MRILAAAACILFAASAGAETLRGTLPVVGSVRGGFDSVFRTELQIHNRSALPMAGRLVVHPAGRPAQPDDPSIPYALAPRSSISGPDVAQLAGISGLASLDVLALEGGTPTLVARAFHDGGELGTSGATIRFVQSQEVLESGDSGAILAPADLARFRLNIGIRSLELGARYRIVVRDASGAIVRELGARDLAPGLFEQRSAESLLGIELSGNESVRFIVEAGSMIVYASSTDNLTNDPSIQIARPL